MQSIIIVMKNRILLLASLLFAGSMLMGQSKNTIVTDSKLNKDVLVGSCNRNGLKMDLFGKYYATQYAAYRPSVKLIKKIAQKIDKTKMTVVFGSWCSDSRIQVPRLYKILDKTGYNENNINLIAVNRSLRALTMDISNLDIKRVPTIIVYQDGKELGRIIESPKKSLEKDLWKIVKKVH